MATRSQAHAQKTEGLDAGGRRTGRVILSSGHMTDAPGRAKPRFPRESEEALSRAIARQLEEWNTGPGDLAICGGARGSDVLFGELCHSRGCHLRLLLPLAVPEFLKRSVEVPGTNWVERFHALRSAPRVETWIQSDHLGPLPENANVFERNNNWIIATGRQEAGTGRLFALLVWDGAAGDGTGGTSHFYAVVKSLGLPVAVINPTAL